MLLQYTLYSRLVNTYYNDMCPKSNSFFKHFFKITARIISVYLNIFINV